MVIKGNAINKGNYGGTGYAIKKINDKDYMRFLQRMDDDSRRWPNLTLPVQDHLPLTFSWCLARAFQPNSPSPNVVTSSSGGHLPFGKPE